MCGAPWALRWEQWPSARLVQWESTARRDVAVGEHRAYCRLADPVTHRRKVILEHGRHCVVVDDLDGRAEHRVDIRFQFVPMAVTLEPTLWVRAVKTPTAGLFIHAFASVPLKAAVLEGDLDPRQGWLSADYGRQAPAPVLVYSAVARLPLRIITVLIPTDDPVAPPPSVSPLVEHGELFGVVFGGRHEVRCTEER
jgi:hypothetical protein